MSAASASRRPLPMNARSGELETQRAGHRRFGPACVGRAVMRRVAPYCARRVPRRGPWGEQRGQNEPERRKTRRRQIDEIVESRRRPAEGKVALILMSDHAVGGVDRLVEPVVNKTA